MRTSCIGYHWVLSLYNDGINVNEIVLICLLAIKIHSDVSQSCGTSSTMPSIQLLHPKIMILDVP